MRRDLKAWPAVLALALLAGAGGAVDKETVEKQRKAAEENWDKLDAGERALAETAHLLLVAPQAQEKKLKTLGEQLEKYYETAARPLFYDEKEKKDPPAWPGKLTVYLFEQPAHYDAFVRRIEKRRLLGEENGSYMVADDRLHVAVCPPRTTGDPPAEMQASQHVAMAVLARKAGARTVLPSWLVHGFGRATFYRVSGPALRAVSNDRRKAATYATKNNRNATDVFNGALEGDEATVLGASVADFLAYGPGRAKFPRVLEGFKPGENGEPKSIYQALEPAELKVDMLNPLWRRFATGR
jgi:hypothetical protein